MQITETKPTVRTFTLEVTADELAIIRYTLLATDGVERNDTNEGELFAAVDAFMGANKLETDVDSD